MWKIILNLKADFILVELGQQSNSKMVSIRVNRLKNKNVLLSIYSVSKSILRIVDEFINVQI